VIPIEVAEERAGMRSARACVQSRTSAQSRLAIAKMLKTLKQFRDSRF